MKVVLITHHLPPAEPGGAGLFAARLAGRLAREGHAVTLIAGTERRGSGACRLEPAAPCAEGVETHRLLLRGGGRSVAARFMARLLDAGAERVLGRSLRRMRPDVLHVHHTLNIGARVIAVGQAAGAAVVTSVHDHWPLCQRIILTRPDGAQCSGPAGGLACAVCLARERPPRPPGSTRLRQLGALAGRAAARLPATVLRTQLIQGAYATSDLITCPSPATRLLLESAGFSPRRLRVLDYGIPALPPRVAATPRPRRPLRFGFLGTTGPHKGLLVALRAAERCEEGAWQLRVHGGPLRDRELRGELERLAATGRVDYRGAYSPEELPEILTALDAVIIPSLWRETGPLTWMEATAAGLPVIAARIGALEERVRHGVDGLLVAPGAPADLARAMVRLQQEYGRLRQGALARSVRDLDAVARDLAPLYAEAREVAARERGAAS